MNSPRSFIRIIRTPYEEPHHIQLEIEASNGSHTAKFQVYVNATVLSEWAKHLEVYPRHNSDVFLFEIGSERSEDRWAYYFRLRVFMIDGSGHCAILLRTNNNQDLPDRELAEFCIRAEPSQINNLGKLFREFSKLKHHELEWWVNDGALR
jgi:hypothetical protein